MSIPTYVTGRSLRDGTPVYLGDKLQGSTTHEMVVLIDPSTQSLIVQPLEDRLKEFVFDIDQFIRAWPDLQKTGSIIYRDYAIDYKSPY
jgi:hypothetical protein